MPVTLRLGVPDEGTATDSTGAQTRPVALTVAPLFCAATDTVNGPAPAAVPALVVPSQSYFTVPAACAPSDSVFSVLPLASLIDTFTSLAAAPSSTAPAMPPAARPYAVLPAVSTVLPIYETASAVVVPPSLSEIDFSVDDISEIPASDENCAICATIWVLSTGLNGS
jgi:hypothetical protein